MSEYVWIKEWISDDEGYEPIKIVFATAEAAKAYARGCGLADQPWLKQNEDWDTRYDGYMEENIRRVRVITADDLDEKGNIEEDVR